MKDVAYLVLAVTGVLFFFLLATGFCMVVIGIVGHVFGIETYQYLSFWEVAGLGFLFGVLGYGARS